MDMTESIAPKSDQMNAEDLLTGPRTFTIKEVRSGSAEQPVEVVLTEFPAGRPFKPSKTVRRLMVAAWGPDSATYAGKRMTLYRDPAVRFGGQDVGGIRVSHMSGIEKTLTIALTTTRGKRSPYVVKPLTIDLPDQPEFRTAAQSKRLADLIREHKLEKSEALAYFGSVIDRKIESTQELTQVEAAKVIEALESSKPEPELVEPEGWTE